MSQKNILHFWRNVEIFNLPDLDIKNIKRLDDLPWEEEKVLQKGKKKIYTLFFGKIPKENIVKWFYLLFLHNT